MAKSWSKEFVSRARDRAPKPYAHKRNRFAGRRRLRLELLETRQLLAFGDSFGIDLGAGVCWSAPNPSIETVAESPANRDSSDYGLQAIIPVPEGVGIMPLEPSEMVEWNSQFWKSVDREGGDIGGLRDFNQGMSDSGDSGGSNGGSNGGSSGGSSGASSGASGEGSFQPFDLADTFKLHSRPTSSKTIYLDFDGFEARGTPWNQSYNRPAIVSPPYDPARDGSTFANAELLQIQQIWHRVAEHFAPFDVNITTQEPVESDLVRSGSGDERWGLRVVQTVDNFASCGCGGFAYIDSFNWGYHTAGATDTPAYSFNSSGTAAAITISHEAGHALGLSHDGNGSNAYYSGHGTGETRWGTIMGAAFSANVQHWSRGEYTGANNAGPSANYNRGPDDLAIITTFNGFGYREDEAGDSLSTTAEMVVHSLNALDPTLVDVSFFGVISTRNDVDMIRFETGSGVINLTIDSYAGRTWVSNDSGGFTPKIQSTNFSTNWSSNMGSSLDVLARLYNSSGTLIAQSNPAGLSASFLGLALEKGIYYLSVEGVGFGNPLGSPPSGYTDYGSLGQFFVRGTVANRPMVDLLLSGQNIAENLPTGTLIGDLSTVDPDPNDTFTYALVNGEGAEDNTNFEIVGDQISSLRAFNFEQKSTQSIRVRTTDSAGNSLERAFVIQIKDLPELESIVVANGQAQRSRVDRLEVIFDGPTTWEGNAFRVVQRGSGIEIAVAVTSSVDAQGRTVAELRFSGPLTRANGALTDGNYQLTIDGSKIFRNGQTLDANRDGLGGDTVNFGNQATDRFFTFFGDANGSRNVDMIDFLAFRSTFGRPSSSSAYNRSMDFDDNGLIDMLDFLQFRGRFGRQLNF
ncbi:MAG: hypothetical protein ACK5N9_23745 [Pirellula sp.]